MIFGSRLLGEYKQLLTTLRVQLNSMQSELERERLAHETERKDLLDRIMALSSPTALGQLRRPAQPQSTTSSPESGGRLNWPQDLPEFPPLEEMLAEIGLEAPRKPQEPSGKQERGATLQSVLGGPYQTYGEPVRKEKG